MSARLRAHALVAYIASRLPEETHIDPLVHAVLRTHSANPEMTVEACLCEMVRELVKSRNELMEKRMRMSELMPPSQIVKGMRP